MSIFNIFLQITTTATQPTDNTKALTTEHSINLFELIIKGGWVMFPIFVLSFLAVYIMIERYIDAAPPAGARGRS